MGASVLAAVIAWASWLGSASGPAAIPPQRGSADINVREASRSDCGPQCLKFLNRYFQTGWNDEDVIKLCDVGPSGLSLKQLELAAGQMGLETQAFSGSLESLKKLRFPAILHCQLRDGLGHFIVVYRWDPQAGVFLVFAPPDRLQRVSPERLKPILSGLGLAVSPQKLSSLGEAFDPRVDWVTVTWHAVLGVDLLVILWVFHNVLLRRVRTADLPRSANP